MPHRQPESPSRCAEKLVHAILRNSGPALRIPRGGRRVSVPLRQRLVAQLFPPCVLSRNPNRSRSRRASRNLVSLGRVRQLFSLFTAGRGANRRGWIPQKTRLPFCQLCSSCRLFLTLYNSYFRAFRWISATFFGGSRWGHDVVARADARWVARNGACAPRSGTANRLVSSEWEKPHHSRILCCPIPRL